MASILPGLVHSARGGQAPAGRMPSRAEMRASPRLVGNAWKSCRGVYGASSRASSSVVSWMSREATHESLAADSYEPIIGALAMLLAANEAAGTIRPGLDPDDVLLMMGFLWPIDPQSDWRTRSN
jgi:hypothetical protein